MDRIDWNAKAKEITKESLDTIDFYVKEGIQPQQAIRMVLDSTTLGSFYRNYIFDTANERYDQT